MALQNFGIKPIKDFLSETYLIPDYQREYSWGKEELEDLWDDLIYIENNIDDKHFFGQIVINNTEKEKYIIDGIAVDEPYRRLKVGKIILDKVVERVKEMGGDSIYLVARAPEFFRKNGFQTIDPDDAPNFFECKQCPQYRVDCHPEVMKLEIV